MLADARCTEKREALWVKPVSPAGEVSCESRGGRRPDDASRAPRRPVLEGVWARLERLLWGRHCYAHKLEAQAWLGLEGGGEDLGVLAQVEVKCVTLPSTHGLHDVEWYASE